MRLGYRQMDALEFVFKHESWHTFSQDYGTKRIIYSLEDYGLVETNRYGMFRITDKGKKIFG